MHITFAPKGVLQIDDARITYKNFSGKATDYNNEGDRNFSVIIDDQEIANALIEEGWNVKIRDPRVEGDAPFMHLPVKVKYKNGNGPAAYLETGNNMNKLDEESIGMIDKIDIISVDLDIRPWDWEFRGRTGRTAYLNSIKVVQKVDRFAEQYASADIEL